MEKVVLLNSAKSHKKLSLELKLKEINNALEDISKKEKDLVLQRQLIEQQLYTPKEQAEINIKRKSEKLNW